VLLDTIIVRSILVPALGTEIGRKIWWPSKLARAEQ
jgi:RND superfamily putative drug exporter